MNIPESCDNCGFYNSKCRHDHGTDIVITNHYELHENCPIKEDVLDAKRFKVKYRGEHFYLCVSEYNGKPWEVFVEHATNGNYQVQFMVAAWDTATRFISRDLKRESLESTIRQLKKSSRQNRDLPAIIADKLRLWL